MNERGTALVAALGIAMILIPLGAFVALQARIDLQIQYNLRAEVEAFSVAEAGLEHALANLDGGRPFDSLLNGPDGFPNTADDGLFPFRGGSPAAFPYAPFRYDVRVTRVRDDLVRFTSRGSGRHGAAKVVEALVVGSDAVWTPAALYDAGDVQAFDLGRNGFVLSGRDHRMGDDVGTANGTAPPVAGLAAPHVDVDTLTARLASDATARIVGAGHTPSITTGRGLDVGRYSDAFAALPNAVRFTAGVDSIVTLGTDAAPQLSIVNGSLDVQEDLSGTGALIIQGTLHVSGRLTFTGLLIVEGGIICEPSSRVVISGALWRGDATDNRLLLPGAGGIAYSSEALALGDRTGPGVLPHLTKVVGWQEDL